MPLVALPGCSHMVDAKTQVDGSIACRLLCDPRLVMWLPSLGVLLCETEELEQQQCGVVARIVGHRVCTSLSLALRGRLSLGPPGLGRCDLVPGGAGGQQALSCFLC